MKTIGIFTKEPVTAEKVTEDIIKNYPFSKKVVINNNGQLFLGKYPREFYITYSETTDINDELLVFTEEDKKIIPFDPIQFNVINFWDSRVIKYVISVILKHYPELYILDETEEHIIPAQEYLDR